jgi:DNA-binding Lrp family transcriptional regulator
MHKTAELDSLDWRLIDLLQNDGSLSNAALAERVALSASQISRRRARLEESGVLMGYRALIDPAGSSSSSMSRSTCIRATMRGGSAIWCG